jgi:hypothetical protein
MGRSNCRNGGNVVDVKHPCSFQEEKREVDGNKQHSKDARAPTKLEPCSEDSDS